MSSKIIFAAFNADFILYTRIAWSRVTPYRYAACDPNSVKARLQECNQCILLYSFPTALTCNSFVIYASVCYLYFLCVSRI